MSDVAEVPRVVILATYFGPLPRGIELWVRSIRHNPEISWVVVCDDPEALEKCRGPNITVIIDTLDHVFDYFAGRLGTRPLRSRPYKLCDFRPVYWMLLEKYGLKCDYWGHCDLDVLFGDVQTSLFEALSSRPFRVFSYGHLCIYRNNYIANNAYRLHHPKLKWSTVFESCDAHGFDERLGIGLIWRQWALPHVQRSSVFDIDPQDRRLSSVRPWENLCDQVLVWRDGRLFLIGRTLLRRFSRREFAYVHYQKRHTDVDQSATVENAIVYDGSRFLGSDQDDIDIQKINGPRRGPRLRSIGFTLRIRLVQLVRAIRIELQDRVGGA